ncbi:30S ribosomal protein S8 [Thermosulfuriphilus ammonigenes]|uniref:Small ribosomal subunit protein uS8 n=1 Tax=Thermosulfuriphilus ammonigenes TaxID=1936021 RepID=A0A6G7PV69_9BACT|nr:30S ribosomal protein S8 [Thermosulfuriphilus ammonigenes]MBA2848532.1 small subunit ribosomal protein S8 [Thermosulfuriphilus ammonigenes]QIJ71323.1 30S ribosomal protein S8 [Thermosulfuriphilus ammonigenes]
MSMTDPIADMLTRIRNACIARHEYVDVPASKMKLAIAKILAEEGYIAGYKFINQPPQGTIRIQLKYNADRKPIIAGLKKISKPGRRIYRGRDELPRVRGGFGIAIISTSKGIMTDHQARKIGVGGEVICAVW